MHGLCVIVDDGEVSVEYPDVEQEDRFCWSNDVPDISASSWELPAYGVYGG